MPFPALNGVQLPIERLCLFLCLNHEVDLLIVSNDISKKEQTAKELKNIGVKNTYFIKGFEKSRLNRFIFEFLGIQLSFLQFNYIEDSLDREIQQTSYDWVWVSPISCYSCFKFLSKSMLINFSFIALGLNDVISGAYFDSYTKFIKRGTLEWSLFLRYVRGFSIRKHERSIYRKVDLLHLQTDKESKRAKLLMLNDSSFRLDSICVASNGRNESLFKLEYDFEECHNIVFFTSFSGSRKNEAHWFLSNVWDKLKVQTSLELWLVGSPPEKNSQLYKDKRVRILGYVTDIETVYAKAGIVVLPIFHQAGLVNRLRDALTAGLPTVCTSYPASTISGVKSDVHLIVEDDHKLFAQHVITLSRNVQLRKQLSYGAKVLAGSFSSWSDFGGSIESKMIDRCKLLSYEGK